jgi:hypothetical protein
MFSKLFFYIEHVAKFWLNLSVDHHHFGYNTKLPKKQLPPKKKKTLPPMIFWGQWFFFFVANF